MKKPSASKKSRSPAKTKPDSLSGLLTDVRQLIQSARRGVATVVDTFQVMTNFEIAAASSSTSKKAQSGRRMARSC